MWCIGLYMYLLMNSSGRQSGLRQTCHCQTNADLVQHIWFSLRCRWIVSVEIWIRKLFPTSCIHTFKIMRSGLNSEFPYPRLVAKAVKPSQFCYFTHSSGKKNQLPAQVEELKSRSNFRRVQYIHLRANMKLFFAIRPQILDWI